MVMPQPKLPKGPNNQSGAATTGTQQTAQKNLLGGGINPNMPRGPQVARQALSSYQQSLGGAAGVPAAPAGGYALFAGLPTPQALGLNRSLGLSNLGPQGGGAPLARIGGAAKPRLPSGALPGPPAPSGAGRYGQPPLPPGGGAPPAPSGAGRYGQPSLLPDEVARVGGAERAVEAPMHPAIGAGKAIDAAIDSATDPSFPSTYFDARPPGGWPPDPGTWQSDWRENIKSLFDEKAGEVAEQVEGLVPAAREEAKPDPRDPFNRWRALGELAGRAQEEAAREEAIPGAADPGAARGGRRDGLSLEEQEALGAPYTEDPDRLHAVATGKVLDPDRDVAGFDDKEVQKVKDNLAKQAEIAYQQNLDQLMRQFAVLGTAGSGAFLMANNNLAVQIYGKLLDEYAQIDLKNLDQIEIDLQEEIGNLIALTSLGFENVEDALDTLEKIDKYLFTTFTTILEQFDLSKGETAKWLGELSEYFATNYAAFESGQISQSEYINGGLIVLNDLVQGAADSVEEGVAAWADHDQTLIKSAVPGPQGSAQPPSGPGFHEGNAQEYKGNIWVWNAESGEWVFVGKAS